MLRRVFVCVLVLILVGEGIELVKAVSLESVLEVSLIDVLVLGALVLGERAMEGDFWADLNFGCG